MNWVDREATILQSEDNIGNMRIMCYQVNPEYGFTMKQVEEYKSAGWRNFNLIFAILAVLLCMVGSFRNLTFMPIIIAKALIGGVQEIRVLCHLLYF